MRLLTLNRATLNDLANELQAQEVLERAAIERIVAEAAPPRPRIAAARRHDEPS
jgi:ATP-dependent Zn protease